MERFFNTYPFSSHGNSKFILLFQRCVYSHEYMDGWKNAMKQHYYLQKNISGSHFNMEDITDADYAQTKKEFINILKQNILENNMICLFKVIHYC